MQVVHQLPSEESSPRRQKRQIHEVTTLRSIPLGAASACLRTRPLSCISWDLISTHPGLSSQTGPSDWSSPAFSSRQPCFAFQTSREQRCMRGRHSSTLPFPNTRQYCIVLMIVCCYLYRKAVKTQIAVPHISCSRLTVMDRGTTVQDNSNNDPATSDCCHQ
jgi:hypothetical protein